MTERARRQVNPRRDLINALENLAVQLPVRCLPLIGCGGEARVESVLGRDVGIENAPQQGEGGCPDLRLLVMQEPAQSEDNVAQLATVCRRFPDHDVEHLETSGVVLVNGETGEDVAAPKASVLGFLVVGR